MKGIILAGGSGTRMYPLTISTSKQLLPIYDKPMIYYPLSILMLSQIREILIISTPYDLPRYEKLFGNGHQLGMDISYLVQEKPNGLAEAFIIGEKFIGDDDVTLILGDNIFYGNQLSVILRNAINGNEGATIFAYHVKDPQRFGVVEIDDKNNIISLEEKPSNPKSNLAITGLYFFDNDVVNFSKLLKPSKRNEIEIVDLLNRYRKKNRLKAEFLGRGGSWLDTGSIEDFYNTSAFVSTLENRQGFKIACLEEIAFKNNWINKKDIREAITFYGNCIYSNYLKKIIQ